MAAAPAGPRASPLASSPSPSHALRASASASDAAPTLFTDANPLHGEARRAIEAVRLASRLCEQVQRRLSSAERQDKQDDSPVTVADYGAQAVVAWSLQVGISRTILFQIRARARNEFGMFDKEHPMCALPCTAPRLASTHPRTPPVRFFSFSGRRRRLGRS